MNRPAPPRRRLAEDGATLAALMVAVALIGILLAVAAQQWSFIKRRELEKELVFRGERIQRALLEHQLRKGSAPTKLEDLTEQPRPTMLRVPPDPMTAEYDDRGELVEGTGEWVLIFQGDRAQPRRRGDDDDDEDDERRRRRRTLGTPQVRPILGVHSSSEEESIGRWEDFPDGTPYVEWRFENLNIGATPGQQATGQDWRSAAEPPPGFGGLRAPGGPPVPDPSALPMTPVGAPGTGRRARPR